MLYAGGALAAPAEHSYVLESSDRLLERAALDVLSSQKTLLSAVKPAETSCGKVVPQSESEPEGGAGVYECAFTELPDPTPSSSPVPAPSLQPAAREKVKDLFSELPGSTLVEWSTSNDNFPGHLKPKNDPRFDMGHTFDMKLSVARVLAKDTKLGKRGDKVGVEVGTELYSQDSKLGWDSYNATMDAWANSNNMGIPVVMSDSNGNPRSVFISSVTHEKPKDKQQALSRNYLKAFKEWNREKFTIIGAVTVESRDLDGKNFGIKMQNGWHKMGGAKYTYNNDSAAGSQGHVTTTSAGQSGMMGEGVDYVDISVAPDVLENDKILQYGEWASSVTAGVQKKIKFFQGRCELVASVSTTLGVQGPKVQFDPNSRIQTGLGAKTALIRNNAKDRSLLTLSAGSALVYYPRSFGEKSTGLNANLGLQSDLRASKSGDRIQTGLQFSAPGQTGIFQALDDNDRIVQLTVRYVFVGKKKKK